ncbi:MAG TPA: CAP domain-containing protein [Pyrinomonadaceae bacterium]|jgi:uncharacterized protein YkwD|nr:CAP domain-containing protein [Pyrinomonadaceae bacterium]
MPTKIVLSVLLIAVFAFLDASPLLSPNAAVPNSSALTAANDEFEVFDRVNRERTKIGLRNLEWDEEAARVARAYSQRMAREGFFDHIDPDGNSVVERAERSRLRRWSMIGENLFECSSYDGYTRLAVSGWLRSPSHRQNMLDRRWTSTGIGIARGRDGSIFVTQVFLEN